MKIFTAIEILHKRKEETARYKIYSWVPFDLLRFIKQQKKNNEIPLPQLHTENPFEIIQVSGTNKS